jgi:integrase
LAAGISANDAAEMLGHADPSLTLRVYAHAKTDRQKAAAGVLAGILQGPENR